MAGMTFTFQEVVILLALAAQWGYTMHRMNTLEKTVGRLLAKMEIKTNASN